MLKAKHHIVIYPLFRVLTVFLLRRKFKSIHILGDFFDNGMPVLVISNHISWWDGFWMMHLNQKIIHRRFHFMMLEEQLRKHWYFQYTGAYSIRKSSRSIIESLNYTIELMKDSGNMTFLFPQGKIFSLYNEFVKFESGAQRIVDNVEDHLQVVFVANFIDYFSDSRPHLYMNIQKVNAKDLKGDLLEEKYNAFFSSSLKKQKVKFS